MAKTKFEIELTGLKIKFEGERDEMRSVSNAVASQFGQILATPTVIDSSPNGQSTQAVLDAPNGEDTVPKRNSSQRKTRARKSGREIEPVVDWKHDASKWGIPLQAWNPTKKAIWLLQVVSAEAGIDALTSSRIAKTFNKHFRESGKIIAGNVSRDLRKAKTLSPPLVQNDTTEPGEPWHLLDAGKKMADSLASEAKTNE
ncbi:hypothetical protein ACFL2H_06845 [Planctomycetota bacterium]